MDVGDAKEIPFDRDDMTTVTIAISEPFFIS